MLSRDFPTRSMIHHAARLTREINECHARGIQPNPEAVRILQAAEARYARLPPHEQLLVNRTFQHDIEAQTIAANQAIEQQQQAQFASEIDALTRELTKGIGKPYGVGLELATALKEHKAVTVKARKLPTGAAADERVRQHTGMDVKTYEAKLDRALEVRNRARNGDFNEWRRYVAQHFPNQSFTDVDRVVKGWLLESVGLEMVRRAEKDTPNTVTLKATPEDVRRLDLLEAVAEVEGTNSGSMFNRGPGHRLREIVYEGYDAQGNQRAGDAGLRADIAEAFLAHGGDVNGFQINAGGYGEGSEGERSTEEIVAVSDEE